MFGSLTKLTPLKVKIKWTKIEQKYFKTIKWIVARDFLLSY